MVQDTYLIAFCWITTNNTTVLFIDPFGLCEHVFMVQNTYLTAFCWIMTNNTTVLFIYPFGLCQRVFKNKTGVYLPKSNRMLLGN